jgi:hypothetical protein
MNKRLPVALSASVCVPQIVHSPNGKSLAKSFSSKKRLLPGRTTPWPPSAAACRWVRVDKAYVFDGEHGRANLLDLFEGRRQLILYHFLFAPGVGGCPSAGCDGCSVYLDSVET